MTATKRNKQFSETNVDVSSLDLLRDWRLINCCVYKRHSKPQLKKKAMSTIFQLYMLVFVERHVEQSGRTD